MALTLNGSTGISGIAGSAGTPALQGNNDANTGYFFATDTLGLSTAGSERLRVDSAGRLLVGTNTGRIAGDVTAQLQVEGTSYHTSSLALIANSGASSGNNSHLTLAKSRGSSDGSNTILVDGDSIGIIQWAASDGTDLNCVAANIRARVNGTPGTNDMPGSLEFGTTADGAAAPTERLRIASSGFVGIGTSSPLRKFHVEDSNSELALFKSTKATGSYVNFKLGANGAELGMIGSGAEILSGGADAGDFGVRAVGDICISSGGHAERMRIDSTGKVIIGHTAVSGWQNSTQLQVLTDSSVGGITTCRYNNDYGGYGLTLARSKTSTIGAHGQVTSGQNIGHIQFVGSDGSAFRALGDITCAADGNVTSTSAEGKIIFKTSKSSSVTPTQAMTIKANHNIEIHDGNIVFETAGNGIDFSATGDATGANSELLDDYEEGTFTPTVGGTNIGGYAEQYGHYVKVGKLVTINVRIQFSANTGSGNFTVNGLPYTSATGTGNTYGSGGITYCNVPLSSADYDPYIGTNATNIHFYIKNTGVGVTLSSNCSNKYMGLAAFYYV